MHIYIYIYICNINVLSGRLWPTLIRGRSNDSINLCIIQINYFNIPAKYFNLKYIIKIHQVGYTYTVGHREDNCSTTYVLN